MSIPIATIRRDHPLSVLEPSWAESRLKEAQQSRDAIIEQVAQAVIGQRNVFYMGFMCTTIPLYSWQPVLAVNIANLLVLWGIFLMILATSGLLDTIQRYPKVLERVRY